MTAAHPSDAAPAAVDARQANEARLDRVRGRLEALQLDALIVTAPSNRRWVAGFTGSAGTVLAGTHVARVASDSRYWEQLALQAPAFELVRTTGGLATWAQEFLAGLGGQRVGFEPAALSYAEYEEWTRALADLPPGDRPTLVPAPKAIEALRMVKEPDELAAEFEGTGARMDAAVADIEGRERLDTTDSHRLFGPLNCRGWYRLHGVHLKDHVHQIAKIKQMNGYPTS